MNERETVAREIPLESELVTPVCLSFPAVRFPTAQQVRAAATHARRRDTRTRDATVF